MGSRYTLTGHVRWCAEPCPHKAGAGDTARKVYGIRRGDSGQQHFLPPEDRSTDGTLEAVLVANYKAQPPWWSVGHHHVLLGHPSALAWTSFPEQGPVGTGSQPMPISGTTFFMVLPSGSWCYGEDGGVRNSMVLNGVSYSRRSIIVLRCNWCAGSSNSFKTKPGLWAESSLASWGQHIRKWGGICRAGDWWANRNLLAGCTFFLYFLL